MTAAETRHQAGRQQGPGSGGGCVGMWGGVVKVGCVWVKHGKASANTSKADDTQAVGVWLRKACARVNMLHVAWHGLAEHAHRRQQDWSTEPT